MIDAQYWSNNEYTGFVFGNQPAVFGVNFADGRIKGYPRDIGPSGISVHYARYVRGNTDYGINNFTDNGDGTITDSATGLIWSKDDKGNGVNTGPCSGMKWEDAFANPKTNAFLTIHGHQTQLDLQLLTRFLIPQKLQMKMVKLIIPGTGRARLM